jgi:hypothetical protein
VNGRWDYSHTARSSLYWASSCFPVRRSQIPDHEARDAVHKPLYLLISEDVRATQDRRMGQGFHYGHQDEGPEFEIGDIYLISMCLEIAPDQ